MADTLEYLLKLSDQFSAPVNRARASLGGLQNSARTATGAINGMQSGLTGLASKVAATVTALTGAITAAAGLKKAIGAAADFESTEVAFEALIGNATKAKQTLAELISFAANTPFELPEVTRSAQKLLGAGVAADQLKGSLNSLGNITAAFQGDLSTVSTIFGQVVNKGKLYAEEIQQFGENGVPALQLLSESMGKSKAEIIALATAGELSAVDLAAAFDKAGGAGGKFAGAMARQAQTTKGLWSTVKDAFDELARTIGKPINDHLLKPLLRDALAVAPRVLAGVQAAVDLAKAAMAQSKLGEILGLSLQIGLARFAVFAGEVIGKIAAGLGQALGAALGASFNGDGMLNFFSGLGDIIRAELGSAFNEVVLNFQTGLAWAIQVLLENLGDIPGVGKFLGLDDFKAEPIEETRKKLEGQNDADALRKSGREKLNKALGIDGLQETLKRELKDLSPEAFRKLTDALNGSLKTATAQGVAGGLANAVPAGAAAPEKGKDAIKRAQNTFNEHAARYGRTALDGVRQKIKGYSFEKQAPKKETFDEFFHKKPRSFLSPEDIKFGKPSGVEPPGQLSRRERRKEAEAQAAKQDKPRWDLVQSIEKTLTNIAVA